MYTVQKLINVSSSGGIKRVLTWSVNRLVRRRLLSRLALARIPSWASGWKAISRTGWVCKWTYLMGRWSKELIWAQNEGKDDDENTNNEVAITDTLFTVLPQTHCWLDTILFSEENRRSRNSKIHRMLWAHVSSRGLVHLWTNIYIQTRVRLGWEESAFHGLIQT